jgi:hypothetical protein
MNLFQTTMLGIVGLTILGITQTLENDLIRLLGLFFGLCIVFYSGLRISFQSRMRIGKTDSNDEEKDG